ncbi:MAG: pyocin activator PrtN family protein [Bradyrhizobium sp.]
MNTAFLLMAQYGGKTIVPIEDVCRDYFEIADSNDLVRIQPAGRLVGSVYDPVGMLDGVAGR